jgi:hypothetical protein
MSAASIALQVQARLIAERQAEQLAEIKRHSAECIMCGEGPTDGTELRMIEACPISRAELWCRECFERDGTEADFALYPVAWHAMKEANR